MFASPPMIFETITMMFVSPPMIFVTITMIFVSPPMIFVTITMIFVSPPMMFVSLPMMFVTAKMMFVSIPVKPKLSQMTLLTFALSGCLEFLHPPINRIVFFDHFIPKSVAPIHKNCCMPIIWEIFKNCVHHFTAIPFYWRVYVKKVNVFVR